MNNPEELLCIENGREVIRIGGYALPAEDFSMSDFMHNDLGMSWLHPGGIISTECLLAHMRWTPQMRVLDLGCGPGQTTRLIAERYGCEVIGIDLDPAMIEEAKIRTVGNQFKRTQFETMDGTKTRFEDQSFDVVIFQSVACFNNKAALFNEVARLLKPNGQLGINESTWITEPTPSVQRVTRSTICQTFKHALMAAEWQAEMQSAGLKPTNCETHEFTSMTPYQMLREEGLLKMAKIMWRVLRNPELNMRLSAVSSYFTTYPGYFGYGIYTAERLA
jgi:ubiquinone/menaquinone biosynthesis C-methylase UbiE